MTREEAADNVRKIKNYMCAGNPMWDTRTIEQTLDIAIKALEQPEIVRCKDCVHRPKFSEDYDPDARDSGLNIRFPDYTCPCQCSDPWYNIMPDDDWFCGNGERK